MTTSSIAGSKGPNAEAANIEGAQPLARVLAIYVGIALVLGMAVYAVCQYLLSDQPSVIELVIEHLAHVALLVMLIYATIYLVLLKTIVRPIKAFNSKLYYIAGGDLTPIQVESNIREVREIAQGINLMIERLESGMPEASLADLASYASDIRNFVQQSKSLDMPTKEMLMNATKAIDDVIAVITKNALHLQKPT